MRDLHDTEVRVTSPTGGEKGKKLTMIGALDPVALIAVGRVAGMGAIKYARYNFLRGTDWSLMFDAMNRHAQLFWSGEDLDNCTTPGHPLDPHDFVPGGEAVGGCNGSGLPHMAHAAWMAMALVSFVERGLGTDDRFKQPVPDPDEFDMLEALRQSLAVEDAHTHITMQPQQVSGEALEKAWAPAVAAAQKAYDEWVEWGDGELEKVGAIVREVFAERDQAELERNLERDRREALRFLDQTLRQLGWSDQSLQSAAVDRGVVNDDPPSYEVYIAGREGRRCSILCGLKHCRTSGCSHHLAKA